MSLKSSFTNKKVVVTGHTGFKGSWLSIWLISLGAKVYGIALDPPTNPSLFEEASIKGKINDNRVNVKDSKELYELLKDIQPDFLFHLAAQPIVSESFLNPLETWNTNVIGTVNILNSLETRASYPYEDNPKEILPFLTCLLTKGLIIPFVFSPSKFLVKKPWSN